MLYGFRYMCVNVINKVIVKYRNELVLNKQKRLFVYV